MGKKVHCLRRKQPPVTSGSSVVVFMLCSVQVRHSSTALLSYLRTVSADVMTLDPFTAAILQILRDYPRDSRVLLPLLKMLDLLLSNGVFDVYNDLHE